MQEKNPAGSHNKKDKLETVADFLNSIVYFLILIIGLPILCGYVTSRIVNIAFHESGLFEEFTMGFSLFAYCISLIPFSFLYLKRFGRVDREWSINTWYLLISRLFIMSIIPTFITLIYFWLGAIFSFESFFKLFPLLVQLIFPFLILGFFVSDKIVTPDWKFGAYIYYKSMRVLILPLMLIFAPLHTLLILKYASSMLIFFYSGILLAVLIVGCGIVFKYYEKKGKQEFGFISMISFLITGFICALLLSLLLFIEMQNFNLMIFIPFLIFCILKVFSLVFSIIQSDSYERYGMPISTAGRILFNISTLLVVYIFGFLFFGISIESAFTLIIFCIVFAIIVSFENYLKITAKAFSIVFFTLNLVIIDLIISFLYLSTSFLIQLTCFTILLIFIVVVMEKQGLISVSQRILIQNGIYIAIFFEIGLIFAIINETIVPITQSTVVNYLFYLSIASLASLYRLFYTAFHRKVQPIFGRVILLHYLYIFGVLLWVLFSASSLFFSDYLFPGRFAPPFNFLVFPSPNFTLPEAIAYNPLPLLLSAAGRLGSLSGTANPYAISMALLLSISLFGLGLLISSGLHHKLGMLSTNDRKAITLGIEYVSVPILYLFSTTLFPSLFGASVGILLILVDSSLLAEQKFAKGKIDEAKFRALNNRLYIATLLVSMLSIFLFFHQIVGLFPSVSLLIASLVLLFYQNNSHKVRRELSIRSLRILNALLLLLISGVLNWALNSVLIWLNSEIWAFYPFTLVFGGLLIVLVFVKLALKQIGPAEGFDRSKIIRFNMGLSVQSLFFAYFTAVSLLIELLRPVAWMLLFCIFCPALFGYSLLKWESRKIEEYGYMKQGLHLYFLALAVLGYSVIGTIVSLVYLLNFALYAVFAGLSATGILLLFILQNFEKKTSKLSQQDGQSPKKNYRIYQNTLITGSLTALVVFIFFFCIELLNLWVSVALFASFFVAGLFLNTIPLFVKNISGQNRYIINFIFIILESILVSYILGQFLFINRELQLYPMFLLALIPLSASLKYLKSFGTKFLEAGVVSSVQSALFIIICAAVYSAVFTYSIRFQSIHYCFLFAALSLIPLFAFDFYNNRFISKNEDLIISLLAVLLINFASLLTVIVFNFTIPLDLHLVLYILLSLPFVEFVIEVVRISDRILEWVKKHDEKTQLNNLKRESMEFDPESLETKKFIKKQEEILSKLTFSSLAEKKSYFSPSEPVAAMIVKLNATIAKCNTMSRYYKGVDLATARLRAELVSLIQDYIKKLEADALAEVKQKFVAAMDNVKDSVQSFFKDPLSIFEKIKSKHQGERAAPDPKSEYELTGSGKKQFIMNNLQTLAETLDNLLELEEYEKDHILLIADIPENMVLYSLQFMSSIGGHSIRMEQLYDEFSAHGIPIGQQMNLFNYLNERGFIKQIPLKWREYSISQRRFVLKQTLKRLFEEGMNSVSTLKVDIFKSPEQIEKERLAREAQRRAEEMEEQQKQASAAAFAVASASDQDTDTESEESTAPKEHISLSLRIINRLKQGINERASQFKISLCVIALVSASYLLFRFLFINQSDFGIGVSLVILLVLSLFGRNASQNFQFKDFYPLSLFTVLFAVLFDSEVFRIDDIVSNLSRILILISLILFMGRISTKEYCGEPVFKYSVNLSLIWLIYSVISPIKLPHFAQLFLLPVILSVSISRTYTNLTFGSLIVPISFAVIFDFMKTLAMPIPLLLFFPGSIACALEYGLMSKNRIWKATAVKSFLGYFTIMISVITFVLFNIYYYEAMKLLNPVLFGCFYFIFFGLKKILPHRTIPLNKSIMICAFGFIYSISLISIFGFFNTPELLAGLLTASLLGLIMFGLLKTFGIKTAESVNRVLIIISCVASFAFSMVLLTDPQIALAVSLGYSLSIDIAAIMFVLSLSASRSVQVSEVTAKPGFIWAYLKYLWPVIPLSNAPLFLSLFELLIDNNSIPLSLLTISIPGSWIFTSLIVSLFYLPTIYTFIANRKLQLFYVYWIQSIALFAWIGENLFAAYPLMQLFFVLTCSFLMLTLFYYKTKQWTPLLIAFPLLAVSNTGLMANLPIQDLIWLICSSIFTFGVYQSVYSFHPKIKEPVESARIKDGLRVSGFMCIYFSLFYLVYIFIFGLGLDSIVAFSTTLIIMGIGLQIGKAVKLNRVFINFFSVLVTALNIGILNARLNYLLADRLTFGILSGIALCLWIIFVFQKAKVLSSGLMIPNQLCASMFTGSSAFIMLWELNPAAFYMNLGLSLLIFTLTSLNISFQKPVITYILISFTAAGFATEFILMVTTAWQSVQYILFVFLGVLVFGMFAMATARSPYFIFEEMRKNYELVSALWLPNSILFGILFTTLFESWLITLDPVSEILLIVLVVALVNSGNVRMIKKRNLFQTDSKYTNLTEKYKIVAVAITYINTALLIALNVPVLWPFDMADASPELIVLYRIWILSLVGLIESDFFDRYLVKLTERKYLNKFIVFYYPFVVVLFSWVLFIATTIIWVSLMAGALALFYWTYSAKRAKYTFPIPNINVILALTMVASTFLTLFQVLNVPLSLIRFEIRDLSISINACILLFYLFTRLNILSRKYNSLLGFIASIFIAFYIEETLRLDYGTFVPMNTAIFIFVVVVLNAGRFGSPLKAYAFWFIVSCCLAVFVTEIIRGNPITFASFDENLLLAFIFGTIYSCITRLLTFTNRHRIDENARPSLYLVIGYPEKEKAQKFHVKWMVFYGIIFALSFARVWNFLYETYIFNLNLQETQQLVISSISIPLALCFYTALLLKYIKKHELWIKPDPLSPFITILRSITAALTYILLPTFITVNLHFSLIQELEPPYMIPLDIAIFSGSSLMAMELFDRNRISLLSERVNYAISALSLLIFAGSLSYALHVWQTNFGFTLLLFSLFMLRFSYYFGSSTASILRKLDILLIYISIAMIGIQLLFTSLKWNWSTLLSILVVQFLIELEVRWKKIDLGPITYNKIHQITILISSLSFSAVVAMFDYPGFPLSSLFLAIGILLIGLQYFTAIRFRTNALVKERNQSVLGQLLYLDLLIYISTLLYPLFPFHSEFEWSYTIALYSLFSLAVSSAAFSIIFFDRAVAKLIQQKHETRIAQILFPIWTISASLDIGYLFTRLMDPLITSSLNPTLSGAISFAFATSASFGIFAAIRYRNRFFNQLMYSISSLLLVLMIYHIGSTGSAIGVTLFLALLYPFIFFLEQITKLLEMLIDALKKYFREIIEFFNKLAKRIAQWLRVHKKTIGFIVSASIAVCIYLISENLFGAIFAFLLLFSPFSPLADKNITTGNFKSKVVYFAALYFALVLFLFAFIDFQLWIMLLFVLLFFGGLLWAARYAERLYRISPIWRIVSGIIAIIDFIAFIFAIFALF